MALEDDAYLEPIFELIKAKLRENEEGMYEEDLFDRLQPAVELQYTVEDFQTAIDMIDEEVVVQDWSDGRFLKLKK